VAKRRTTAPAWDSANHRKSLCQRRLAIRRAAAGPDSATAAPSGRGAAPGW